MEKRAHNIAAILAGGVGSRTGNGEPKQFLDMAGKTLLERTVDVFEAHPAIDRIIVVSHPDHLARVEAIRHAGDYRKWHATVPGGAERYLSSVAAVEACTDIADGNLLIHDAARPFVSHAIINRLLAALDEFTAAVPVISLSDTLLEVDENYVKCAPNRENFRLAQTPQAFRLSTFRKAAMNAKEDANIYVTDDCGLYSRYFPQEKIKIVEGEKCNQKLTYQTDIEEFEKKFKKIDKNACTVKK